MAKMTFLAHKATTAPPESGVPVPLAILALVPQEDEPDTAWSIDQEFMGSSRHDSSWLLAKGLDVIEGVALDFIPPEWQRRWRYAAACA